MRSGLQDLTGEVARLKAECDYFLQVLDRLEDVSNHQSWLSEAQESDITVANHAYGRSATENLERATDDLRNWWDKLELIISGTTTKVAH